tara:strand:- start:107 stop:673 length:567 start_codon:yes stop_codon:yes gene_type:complete
MRLYRSLGRRTNGPTRPQKEMPNSRTSVIETSSENTSKDIPGMDGFLQKYPTFDIEHFLSGATNAYKIIVKAFSEGDLNALKPLLSKEVYNEFEIVIGKRDKRKDVCFSKFVGEVNASIIGALIENNFYKITLEYKSRQINTTHDKTGVLIDGNPDTAFDSVDIWSFCKEIGSTSENWYLVETKEGDL